MHLVWSLQYWYMNCQYYISVLLSFLGHFDGNAMPSAGAVPFVQSFLCNFNNPCYATVTEDENAGTTGSYSQST